MEGVMRVCKSKLTPDSVVTYLGMQPVMFYL